MMTDGIGLHSVLLTLLIVGHSHAVVSTLIYTCIFYSLFLQLENDLKVIETWGFSVSLVFILKCFSKKLLM